MKGQTDRHSCGGLVIVNSLSLLGEKVSECKAKRLAGTDPVNGTDENGIMTAIKALGYKSKEFDYESPHKAWRHLRYALNKGKPVIISVDFGQHWMTCIGLFGRKVIVFDSSPAKAVVEENGVLHLKKNEMIKRWKSARSVDVTYYGIVVTETKDE